MNLVKRIFFFILLSCILAITTAQAIEPLDRIVAIVNNNVITQQQLAEQIEVTRQQLQAQNQPLPNTARLRQQVLNQMIDDELQQQLASNSGLKIDDAGLNKVIMDIAQRNGLTLEQLREKLQEENIPYTKYRQQIRKQLLINRLQQDAVAAKIIVSEQEITDMLAHMPKLPEQKPTYHVEDLLLAFPNNVSATEIAQLKQTALALLQQAKNGSSFQQLIAQASNAKLSLSGGDLGWRTLNELPDLFQTAVAKLKVGEIAGPIQAANGFHLLRLIELKGNDTLAPHTVTATHTRHILIKTSPLLNDAQAAQRLKEIRADILRGGSFAEFAKKYSQDPGSAFKGGDLGWTFPGVFDPTFEAQIKKLAINQISLPFKTQFGWHIVQVLGRTQKLQTAQNISRQQAAKLVYQKKFQESLKNWLRQLRNQAYVKIMP